MKVEGEIEEAFQREQAETIQLMLEYAPDPPFVAGRPEAAPPGVVARTRTMLTASRAEREAIVARIVAARAA